MQKTKKKRGDFYAQINSKWIKTHKIPKYESSINCFSVVENKIKLQLRNLFVRMKKKNTKIAKIYHSFLNVNEKMVVMQIKNLTELFFNASDSIPKMINISSLHSIKFPFQFSVNDDLKTSSKQSLIITESALTLPDFSMYTKGATENIKNKFITFVKTKIIRTISARIIIPRTIFMVLSFFFLESCTIGWPACSECS